MAVVTVARYRVITGDTSTDTAEVSARIEDATIMVEEELDRPLELAERTETIRLASDPYGWTGWLAYPRSTPIMSVPADSAYRIEDDVTLSGVQPATTPFWTWSESYRPHATITWTGGYTSSTLPKKLEAAICDLAHALLTPAAVPVGATSIRVGDVAVTYSGSSDSGLDVYVPGLWERIRRYRHRRTLR
jgi:hypothetical protein